MVGHTIGVCVCVCVQGRGKGLGAHRLIMFASLLLYIYYGFGEFVVVMEADSWSIEAFFLLLLVQLSVWGGWSAIKHGPHDLI